MAPRCVAQPEALSQAEGTNCKSSGKPRAVNRFKALPMNRL